MRVGPSTQRPASYWPCATQRQVVIGPAHSLERGFGVNGGGENEADEVTEEKENEEEEEDIRGLQSSDFVSPAAGIYPRRLSSSV